jgi:hypothetical protein
MLPSPKSLTKLDTRVTALLIVPRRILSDFNSCSLAMFLGNVHTNQQIKKACTLPLPLSLWLPRCRYDPARRTNVWGLMGAPGICSEPNRAPGFAQPNGGFTGLTVGARELTHRIVLCKTFIYIYTIVWTVRPYSRCWVNDF